MIVDDARVRCGSFHSEVEANYLAVESRALCIGRGAWCPLIRLQSCDELRRESGESMIIARLRDFTAVTWPAASPLVFTEMTTEFHPV